jgi:hypothetical protein
MMVYPGLTPWVRLMGKPLANPKRYYESLRYRGRNKPLLGTSHTFWADAKIRRKLKKRANQTFDTKN